MESIDRLRRYVECHDKITGLTATCINHLIDSIEEEVEGMRDFCERLDDAATKREDVTLWGVDYTALPVDAEGEPIHVGDVMEWVDEPDVSRVVSSIQLAGDGWWVYVGGTGRRPDKYRHYHAPTVEDVLDEFVARWMETHHDDLPLLKAEYAAKLTLRGDE